MVDIRIPPELEVYWDRVVKERFDGDEERAAQEAVVRLIQSEKSEIVDEERFNLAIENVNRRREKASEISQNEFSEALARRKKRMERARNLFGKLGDDE